MTQLRPETVERERDKLFLTDAELIRRLGVPEKVARPVLRTLESRPGAPKKQKMWGNRWYWPAVEQYLNRMSGMMEEGAARLATENRDRTRLPRVSTAVLRRRSINERQ